MSYLIVTLLVITTSYLLYRAERKKRFKVFGIIFGLFSLAFLYLISEVELASTPANYKVNNHSSNQLKSFFIIFYSDIDPRVEQGANISPNEEINSPGFETEGAKEIWIVTTTNNNVPFSLDKLSDKTYADYKFTINENSPNTILSSEEKTIISTLSNYRLKKNGITILVFLNFAVMILFFIKKKKK